jgi:ATP-binding cassette subfamily A (ABC1) protein 3
VNLYSLLCDGTQAVSSSSLGSITKFGGPILYLFIYMSVLLAILVWVDSGSRVPRRRNSAASFNNGSAPPTSEKDVTPDASVVAASGDLLQVLNISKSYGGKQVLDDISLGVSKGSVFALLGPNGAGKTTTFNIIRKVALPSW